MMYVSFGLQKGGSTLTALLTRAILECGGHPHIPFSGQDRFVVKRDGTFKSHGEQINNVNNWQGSVVATLDRGVPDDRIVVFRTHTFPTEAIGDLIRRGRAKCHVAIRDPRDIVLSMFDTVSVAWKLGRVNRKGVTPGKVETTFDVIANDMNSARQWLAMPDSMLLEYEDTAFNPSVSIAKISNHLKVDVPPDKYGDIFREAASNPSGKRNVAQLRRHVREMKPSDQSRVLERFADFYRDFYPDAAVVYQREWKEWFEEPPSPQTHSIVEVVYGADRPAGDIEGEVWSVPDLMIADQNMAEAWWRPVD